MTRAEHIYVPLPFFVFKLFKHSQLIVSMSGEELVVDIVKIFSKYGIKRIMSTSGTKPGEINAQSVSRKSPRKFHRVEERTQFR